MNLEDRFEKDVESHDQTVMLDDRLHRHLVNRKPHTNVYHFNITTWPGYLSITGDMGSYTFSRIPDMFEFFRGKGKPSYQYWAEKAVAVDPNCPPLGFSQEKFRKYIEDTAKEYEDNLHSRELDDFHDTVQLLLLSADGECESVAAVSSFDWEGENPFMEWWDHDFREIDPRFKWCCKAIRWAINKYDEGK